jgi:hypothetical protein
MGKYLASDTRWVGELGESETGEMFWDIPVVSPIICRILLINVDPCDSEMLLFLQLAVTSGDVKSAWNYKQLVVGPDRAF